MPKNTNKPEQPTPAPAPVIQVVHAFTLKQWRANPQLQAALREKLEDPIMKLAFQTILFSTMPSEIPGIVEPGMTADMKALLDSNRLHHKSGMTATYRALQALAQPKDEPARSADWGDMLEEDEK